MSLSVVLVAVCGCTEFRPRASTADTGVEQPEDVVTGPCVGKVCDDSDQCTQDVCDAETGECVYSPVTAGSTCDDGLFCTQSETCSDGVCGGGVARDCPGGAGGCILGVCNEETRECETQPAQAGAACDDGDPCNVGETCDGEACIGGGPMVCVDPDDPCLTAKCDPETSECASVPLADSAQCEDGDPCTVEDQCTGGVCGGVPRDCSGQDEGCTVGVCDPLTGSCVEQPAEQGASCDDLTACTVDDVCDGNVCAGIPTDCGDLDGPCTEGVCNDQTGECVTKNLDDIPCEDGSLCTGPDACVVGVCVPGASTECPDGDDVCQVGLCDPETGVCGEGPGNEGGTCEDEDPCTTEDVCVAGTCAGTAKDCSDVADLCQKGVCLKESGVCVAQPDPLQDLQACDDGQFCTVDKQCVEGVCLGDPRDCSALDEECVQGTCDDFLDACVPIAIADDDPCSDGQVCTLGDTCKNGECGGDEVLDCSGLNNQCQNGFCSEADGGCIAVFEDPGTVCDDNLACTNTDTCTDGVCGGIPVDCTDLSTDCLAGACSETASGCVTVPVLDGATCSDGIECTADDFCSAGKCIPGDASECPCLGPARSLAFGGGCVEVPGSPFLQAETGFTVEFWLRTESKAPAILMDQRITTAVGESDWHIEYQLAGGDGQLRFRYGNVTGADSQIGMPSVELNDGEWHHVAVTRDDKTLRWWVDGNGLPGNVTTNIQSLSNESPLWLGCSAFGGQAWDGSLDDIRISSFARYSKKFTPPGRHSRDAATVALWHADDDPGGDLLLDVTGQSHNGTLSGAVSLEQDPAPGFTGCCGDTFLTAGEECDDGNIALGDGCTSACVLDSGPPQQSMSLGGAGCIQTPGDGLLKTVGDLTVEFWIRTPALGPARVLDKRKGQAGWSITFGADGRLSFEAGANDADNPEVFTQQAPINDDQWHHVAFIYSSVKVVRWYLDGEPGPTGKLDAAGPLGNDADLFVGCSQGAGQFFVGYLDGLRITDKLFYTAQFTPEPIVPPLNSSLLLYTFDQPILDGVVQDLSSGAHPGTVTGTTLIQSAVVP